MWALRRTSNPLKNRVFSVGAFRASCARTEIASSHIEENAAFTVPSQVTSDHSLSLKRFYSDPRVSLKPFWGRHRFSSQAGMKSSGEEDDDLEDGFSELGSPASADATQDNNVEDESGDDLISVYELSGEESNDDDKEGPQDELELSDTETDVSEKRAGRNRAYLALFKAIMAAPGLSINNALDKWVEEGNDMSRAGIALTMLNLRRRRLYAKALQFSEWLESTKHLDFVERDYASRLDLIAKVRGLTAAENYIENIPKSFRGELIYRTLLSNCVAAQDVRKAVEVFGKMKDLQFSITSFAYNQMILLYKKADKKKIADVLLLMEKENIKPTRDTYSILIDTKGQSNDITGMDQIVETMKAEGIELDIETQAILANYYVSGGLVEKAEAVLKEMERGNTKDNRLAYVSLLPLYASLGKADEVARLWKVCEQNPQLTEYKAAIKAWGKLNKIEEAEAVFDQMSKKWKKLYTEHYLDLLKVYVDHKMLSKGKDLVKKMAENGCRIGPLTWDALVKLYVEAGEVEKADSVLQKASQKSQMKPLFSSYIAIMEQYAKRGDVHNAEKIFNRLRQVGYVPRIRQYLALVDAYVNAKVPAYGLRERMRGDNVVPSRMLAWRMSLVDAFRKTPVTELLD